MSFRLLLYHMAMTRRDMWRSARKPHNSLASRRIYFLPYALSTHLSTERPHIEGRVGKGRGANMCVDVCGVGTSHQAHAYVHTHCRCRCWVRVIMQTSQVSPAPYPFTADGPRWAFLVFLSRSLSLHADQIMGNPLHYVRSKTICLLEFRSPTPLLYCYKL